MGELHDMVIVSCLHGSGPTRLGIQGHQFPIESWGKSLPIIQAGCQLNILSYSSHSNRVITCYIAAK